MRKRNSQITSTLNSLSSTLSPKAPHTQRTLALLHPLPSIPVKTAIPDSQGPCHRHSCSRNHPGDVEQPAQSFACQTFAICISPVGMWRNGNVHSREVCSVSRRSPRRRAQGFSNHAMRDG